MLIQQTRNHNNAYYALMFGWLFMCPQCGIILRNGAHTHTNTHMHSIWTQHTRNWLFICHTCTESICVKWTRLKCEVNFAELRLTLFVGSFWAIRHVRIRMERSFPYVFVRWVYKSNMQHLWPAKNVIIHRVPNVHTNIIWHSTHSHPQCESIQLVGTLICICEANYTGKKCTVFVFCVAHALSAPWEKFIAYRMLSSRFTHANTRIETNAKPDTLTNNSATVK